jgi:hypothetical protein
VVHCAQKFLYGASDVLEPSYALAGPRILGDTTPQRHNAHFRDKNGAVFGLARSFLHRPTAIYLAPTEVCITYTCRGREPEHLLLIEAKTIPVTYDVCSGSSLPA